jgi:hypothetical protein
MQQKRRSTYRISALKGQGTRGYRCSLSCEPLESRRLLSLEPAFEFELPMWFGDFDSNDRGEFVIAGGGRTGFGGEVQRYSAAGIPQGAPLRTDLNRAVEYVSHVELDEGGNFVVWLARQDGHYLQVFNADGTPRSSRVPIDTNVAGEPEAYDIAMDTDGDIVATWRELPIGFEAEHPGFETRVQLFDSNGVAKGPAFGVSAREDSRILAPQVVMDDAGNFTVAYLQSYWGSLHFQQFWADGTRRGGPVAVAPANFIGRFDIDMASDGRFAVSWITGGSLDTRIHAIRYSADGIAETPVLKANQQSPSANWQSRVAIADNGAMVLAWHSAWEGYALPDGAHAFARRILPDGTPDGPEFRIHQDPDRYSVAPEVLTDAFGNVVFVAGGFAYGFVVAPNPSAIAADDAYTVNQDATLTVSVSDGLLANDIETDGDGAASDFDGDGIADVIDPDDNNNGTPDTSDAAQGKLKAQLVAPPEHGFVHINQDGSFTYTPSGDFTGTDLFKYRVVEQHGEVSGTATAAVQVRPTADRSVFLAENVIVPVNGGALAIPNWATFLPGTGGTFTPSYAVSNFSDSGLFETPPAVAPDGTLTFAVAQGRDGVATFDVTLDDGQGNHDTQTFTITVGHVADAPVLLNAGTLVIRDSNGNDTIEIFGNGRPGEILVRGSTGRYHVLGVTSDLRVKASWGDDSLNLHDLYIAGSLDVALGNGNNDLRLGAEGVVSSAKPLHVTGGAGKDNVVALNVFIGSNGEEPSYFYLYEEDDAVTFADTASPGTFQLSYSSLSPTVVATDRGNDTLVFRYVFIPNQFDVNAGGDTNQVTLFGSAITGYTQLNGGMNGNVVCDTNFLPGGLRLDASYINLRYSLFGFGQVAINPSRVPATIKVESIEADEVSIYGGNWPPVQYYALRDTVEVRDSVIEALFVDLGEEDDTLTLSGNHIRASMFLDGGRGGDKLLDLGGVYPKADFRVGWEGFS